MRTARERHLIRAGWILVVSVCWTLAGLAQPQPIESIPVILLGSELPWTGVLPAEIAAFAYDEGWRQIPVQVDERDVVEYAVIYGRPDDGIISRGGFGNNVFGEVYCDSDTFTGADSDPFIDDNDEISFMLFDAGARAPEHVSPDGVLPDLGLVIELTNPIADATTHVYLFRHDGSLDPSAGVSYVDYDFHLLSGDYKETYNTTGYDPGTGERNSDHGEQLNPEDSVIRTSIYERHWSYRWTCDSLSLLGGPSLIEREDYWIAPGSCGRHNGTFNAQEGAMIANISGPVRAIRSVMGANSGPLVQQDRIYYQAREDVAIYFRVHPRPSVGIFYVDHTLDAVGMTYRNELNVDGVTIDGRSDRLTLGPTTWELVAGELGTVLRLHSRETDIPFTDNDVTHFYIDELNTGTTLCDACLDGCRTPQALGDQHLIGASGVWITAPMPNTDPALLGTSFLTSRVTIYYSGSQWTAEDARRLQQLTTHPIIVNISGWPATKSGD